jgi:two-component system response regulator MprA
VTATEFALLDVLVARAGRVVGRSEIHTEVWGYDFGSSSNSLAVYVGYLRRKLEEPGRPRLLHTVRGFVCTLSAHPHTRTPLSTLLTSRG